MDEKEKPVIKKADPQKFLGGQNVEKLKSILKEADEFTDKAKERLNQISGMFDRFMEVIGKFDTTVEAFKKIVDLNQEAYRRLIENLKAGASYLMKGGQEK